MPTYDYTCDSCGHSMEAFQRMVDEPLTVCPECNNPTLKRLIGTGAGIIFKGGGFYETDFKDKKGSSGKTGSSGNSSSKAEKTKESSSASSKASKGTASGEKSSKASS